MADFDYAVTQWNGSNTAVIEGETDPWLRDADGNDIDLAAYREQEMLAGRLVMATCGSAHDVIDGVIAPINTDYGIETCDECQVYDSDLVAAAAVAAHIGPDITVWFHGTN